MLLIYFLIYAYLNILAQSQILVNGHYEDIRYKSTIVTMSYMNLLESDEVSGQISILSPLCFRIDLLDE